MLTKEQIAYNRVVVAALNLSIIKMLQKANAAIVRETGSHEELIAAIYESAGFASDQGNETASELMAHLAAYASAVNDVEDSNA